MLQHKTHINFLDENKKPMQWNGSFPFDLLFPTFNSIYYLNCQVISHGKFIAPDRTECSDVLHAEFLLVILWRGRQGEI